MTIRIGLAVLYVPLGINRYASKLFQFIFSKDKAKGLFKIFNSRFRPTLEMTYNFIKSD